jgi:hypothetical protein
MSITALTTEQRRQIRDYLPPLSNRPPGIDLAQILDDAFEAASSSSDLASTASGEGASLVGVNDAGGFTTAATVEAHLQEIDPGAWFESTEQTGTGASQNVAHGLGRAPRLVIVTATEGHDGAGGAGTQAADIAYGVHTSTNVVVTVSNGAKFRAVAV